MVYISVKVRHNSIISIKSDRSYKNDDIKNFENIVYINERGRHNKENNNRNNMY